MFIELCFGDERMFSYKTTTYQPDSEDDTI